MVEIAHNNNVPSSERVCLRRKLFQSTSSVLRLSGIAIVNCFFLLNSKVRNNDLCASAADETYGSS